MLDHGGRAPWWVTAIIILAIFPVFSLPFLLVNCPDGSRRTLLWIYPFYVGLSGWLAWMSWRDRPYMTWILLALMLLSHAAAFMLDFAP